MTIAAIITAQNIREVWAALNIVSINRLEAQRWSTQFNECMKDPTQAKALLREFDNQYVGRGVGHLTIPEVSYVDLNSPHTATICYLHEAGHFAYMSLYDIMNLRENSTDY